MPKSYLAAEPGAQRALKNKFDPYQQVLSRLKSYHAIGHPTDKIELIILGGTWSVYPKSYQVWFIKRCFDALNNQTSTTLKTAQKINQTTAHRCVGLSLETRPDYITPAELIRFRRLGCTKVQIGLQSLNDKLLKLNQRGHNNAVSRQAIKLLRQAGFKIQSHWMANLYGSTVKADIADFKKLFSDYRYRPDELKIYPTSLIANTKLMDYYTQKKWQPYTQTQLLKLLTTILPFIPPYCRVTRIVRDFSSFDIVTGSKTSNLRQIVEKQLKSQKKPVQEIRFREIRHQPLDLKKLSLKVVNYKTSIGQEKFLQFITSTNQIVAFLRLSLPQLKPFIKELNHSAIIREIHVYGQSLPIGDKQTQIPQHLGLGTKLIHQARLIAQKNHYQQLSVISAIGTKQYYRQLGFTSGPLYQHLNLKAD